MYKLLIYGIILITNINFVLAETTLNCGIAYSVEQIREIAFNNVPMKISSDAIQNKLKYKKRFLFNLSKKCRDDPNPKWNGDDGRKRMRGGDARHKRGVPSHACGHHIAGLSSREHCKNHERAHRGA